MANPQDAQCEAIGQAFLKQYYATFDKKDTRAQVCNFYHPQLSTLSCEGQRFIGAEGIINRYCAMPFDNLFRDLTTVDIQPLSDVNGIIIQVIGQLRTDAENDKVMGFSQTFVLRMVDANCFLFNDIFRLIIHNNAA